MDDLMRCPWAESSALMRAYHDEEWGVPVHDERGHFELLTLEGAQAGLSWSTILAKRAAYRRAFAGFEPVAVARFTNADLERLMADAGIVRNRLKIALTVANARAFLRVQEEFGTFDDYVWCWVDGEPTRGRWRSSADVPCTSPVADKLSKYLLRRGFKFVGPTIVYSYLQAAGLVDDHLDSCLSRASSGIVRPVAAQ